MNKVIPIRFPEDVWEQLRKHTKMEGLAPSTWIRMLVIRELKKVSK